jgi:hypothetical protein
MGSGFDDWIYLHFFTITVNYDSSQSMTVSDSLHSSLDYECFLVHCDQWRTTNHYSHIEHLSLSLVLRPTVSRPLCLGIKHPSGAYDQTFITVRQLRVCWCGALSLNRGRVCRLQLLLALASAIILGFESRGLVTIFYCLRFETSIFIASYDSQGYGGCIRPRLHTGLSWTLTESQLFYNFQAAQI